MTDTKEMRFEFGQNWHKFIRRNFTEERCQIARDHILAFSRRQSLKGVDFLDIGCGSGLHSLAAYQSGAGRIHGFDYDQSSVAATKLVRERVGNPENWTVERGDVLDKDYVAKLGTWNFVYSWGVLHHTGDVWQAVRNAQSTVAEGGTFYIALYSADVAPPESQAFWLDIKKKYNQSSSLEKQRMVWWYIWVYIMQKDVKKFPEFLKRAAQHKLTRGMNLFADIRDWLGGWPMEYTADQQVVDMLEQEYGFALKNVSTGEACSEFLFERTGTPATRTSVAELVARKKAVVGSQSATGSS